MLNHRLNCYLLVNEKFAIKYLKALNRLETNHLQRLQVVVCLCYSVSGRRLQKARGHQKSCLYFWTCMKLCESFTPRYDQYLAFTCMLHVLVVNHHLARVLYGDCKMMSFSNSTTVSFPQSPRKKKSLYYNLFFVVAFFKRKNISFPPVSQGTVTFFWPIIYSYKNSEKRSLFIFIHIICSRVFCSFTR